jgi:probable rRNA maturation factor
MPVSVLAPRGFSGLARPLRALVAGVLRQERRRPGEIAVVLAGDALLRQTNRDWRGIDRATDVISFAYDEHEPDAASRPVRGDLLVSLDRVRDQARRYRVTPGAELARLVAHGTLHLCGHDHARPAERRRMRAREDAALRAVRARISELDRGLAVGDSPRAGGGRRRGPVGR